jgi:hypothetical protein
VQVQFMTRFGVLLDEMKNTADNVVGGKEER